MAANTREKLLSCPYDPWHIVPIGSYQRHLEECRELHTKKDEPPTADAAALHSAENWAKKMVEVTVADSESVTAKRPLRQLRKRHVDNLTQPTAPNELPGPPPRLRRMGSPVRRGGMDGALKQAEDHFEGHDDEMDSPDDYEMSLNHEGPTLMLLGNYLYYRPNDPRLGREPPHGGN
ncbi:uncharacterized protein LOC144171124 [Haemaphysalis longicornis]